MSVRIPISPGTVGACVKRLLIWLSMASLELLHPLAKSCARAGRCAILGRQSISSLTIILPWPEPSVANGFSNPEEHMDYHLIPPSPAETELIEKYREIEEQYHAAAKAAQNYFLPRVKAALKA